MKKTAAKKAITPAQFEEAAKRYASNTAKMKTIVDKSEEKIKAEMAKRHTALGNMPVEIAEDEALLKQYAEDNKGSLFVGTKTHDTGLGIVISYRTGTPKLVYIDGVTAENLLQQLQKKSLLDYVKTTYAVDARAVIADADTNKKLSGVLATVGASVEQEETISVKYKAS